MFCSGCGVPEGTGHSLGCSYGGVWYTTRSESSAGSNAFSCTTVADTNYLNYAPCSECGKFLNHDIYCSLSPIRNGMCHLHISQTPCPWCAETARQVIEEKCLSDFQNRVQEKINDLYREQLSKQLLIDDQTVIQELYSQQEEPLANNIDEQQITLLDGMRSARDAAYRYAQSKHDRATLMRIQADALTREGDEIVAEINENVPVRKSK